MQRTVSQLITATTDDTEIGDGTELARLGGIPAEWGSLEGDAVQVTLLDGRMATFLAYGDERPAVFSWGYDTTRTRIARLDRISGTVLRVTQLSHLPEPNRSDT